MHSIDTNLAHAKYLELIWLAKHEYSEHNAGSDYAFLCNSMHDEGTCDKYCANVSAGVAYRSACSAVKRDQFLIFDTQLSNEMVASKSKHHFACSLNNCPCPTKWGCLAEGTLILHLQIMTAGVQMNRCVQNKQGKVVYLKYGLKLWA